MDTKQPLSLFLVAVLVASVFAVVGISSLRLQSASAQDVTVTTSVGNLGGTFFGHGAVQVVIKDETTNDDADVLTTTVDVFIDVEGISDTFTIPDTSDGSQRFEFFLVHEASDIIGALDGIADTPTVITFGTGGDLDTGDDLFEEAEIDIDYESEPSVSISYEEVPADLTLDRTVPYGSESLVHMFIDDQDGNVNPTEKDLFTLTDAELGALFSVTGAVFDTTTLTFEETGTNTGVFEGIVSLNDTAAADDELDPSSETVALTLNDQANYDPTLTYSNGTAIAINGVPANDSPDTSDVTFEIEDNDGEIDDISAITFSSEVAVVVRDDDQNIDSDESDVIEGALTVEVDNAGGDSETVDLEETDDNTGAFEIDLSNGELRVTFLADGGTPTVDNGILELRVEDISEDLIISYLDPLDDNSAESTVAEFTTAIELVPVAVSAPETVGINDEFTVTINDKDLDDNKRTGDSYTIDLTGTSPFELEKGGDVFGEIYQVEIDFNGDPIDFGAESVPVTITETGANTGLFEFDIDMEDIGAFGDGGAELAIDDGDEVSINILDFMADEADPDEDEVTIEIGKPTVGVDFSRTNVPIPPEDGSLSEAGVGTSVHVTMILTDPARANQSSVEETFDLVFGDGPGQFILEVDGDDVNNFEIDALDGADSFFGTVAGCDNDGGEAEIVDGVSLCEVMTLDALAETGKATGVFEAELEFSMDGVDMDAGDWQDAEFTFTYTDETDEEESGGFTFRGNDGIVTVDQPSAKSGTMVTITVEDQDLNLDDAEIDHFDSGDLLGAAGIQALLLIETEDDEIDGGVDDDTFDETAEDSGVFTAEFEIGEDIQITDLEDDEIVQASNILITYDDEIDSTGGGGDETEVNIPIVSSTGSIQVTPELVGPATTLNVLIIDSDLDQDASSPDDYDVPAGQEDTDDFFVSFSSDRNEVGEGSPDIEETGSNTGVFMFTIELITDEEACQDDDLGDAEFQAEGGDTDATIGACPGDLVSIRYEDENIGGGGSGTVSEVVEVSAFDPEFVADKDIYGVGDRVTVTISDPDANRDSDIADSLTDIRVRSDSDQVGEELSAIETGRDTGVFRLTFGTTSGTAGGAISVKTGDDITITYTDEFPADFEEEEEDKDFQFTVPVGQDVDGGSVTVTPPQPTDVTGEELDEVPVGQQVVLTTNAVNQGTSPQPFVALIEVRDSSDVTIFLAWQTGTLNPSGQAQVGLSWTPEETGNYTVRTFVISSLNNPRILSPVAESDIAVS